MLTVKGEGKDSGREGKAREKEAPPPPSLASGGLPGGGTLTAARWREGGGGTRSGSGAGGVSELLGWCHIVFQIEERNVQVNRRDRKTWANQGRNMKQTLFS
jgi:hypothetical protein